MKIAYHSMAVMALLGLTDARHILSQTADDDTTVGGNAAAVDPLKIADVVAAAPVKLLAPESPGNSNLVLGDSLECIGGDV